MVLTALPNPPTLRLNRCLWTENIDLNRFSLIQFGCDVDRTLSLFLEEFGKNVKKLVQEEIIVTKTIHFWKVFLILLYLHKFSPHASCVLYWAWSQKYNFGCAVLTSTSPFVCLVGYVRQNCKAELFRMYGVDNHLTPPSLCLFCCLCKARSPLLVRQSTFGYTYAVLTTISILPSFVCFVVYVRQDSLGHTVLKDTTPPSSIVLFIVAIQSYDLDHDKCERQAAVWSK